MSAHVVTMVFTDLVSSTAMKALLPGGDVTVRNQRYLEVVLMPHRQRMEPDLAAYGGRVVKTEGDAYFLVFTDPLQAVQWATAVQMSHEVEPIDTPLGPLQVKIGIHTGAPLTDPRDPSDFIGQEVDYAARVAALAGGGQIILSEATAALVRAANLRSIELHAHGERELKGIGRVPVWELLHNGRQPQPLKQVAQAPSNLPPAPDGFVGRIDLLAEVREHLRAGGVTVLKGGGGFGKTTVALAAAHMAHAGEETPGGVAWIKCELRPSHEECFRQMANVFFGNRMEQEHTASCEGQVGKHLRECQALVVLDNFETVENDLALLHWLAEVRPPARVLITTRQVPSGLRGKVVEVRELARNEAATLFRHRASTAGLPIAEGQQDELVNAVCAVVGDQPLAIELLAARAARLPLSRLLERMQRDLTLLDAKGDPNRPERHRSARACVALSFEHLGSAARDLLLRLSVLPDGAGPETITAVLGSEDWDEAAEELVAASMWRLEGTRYTTHQLVRQFALEQLGDGRADAELRAARAFTGLAQVKGKLTNLTAAHSPAKGPAFEWFAAEWRNLMVCADYVAAAEDWATLQGLSQTIFFAWFVLGHWTDAESLYQQALAGNRSHGDRAAEGNILGQLAFVRLYLGRLAEAENACRRSLAILHEIGDRRAEGRTLSRLVRVLQLQGRLAEAETASEQSLAIIREYQDRSFETLALFYCGNLYFEQERWEDAEAAYRQSLDIAREQGNRLGEGSILNHLGVLYRELRRWTDSEQMHQQSLAVYQQLGDSWRGKLGSQWHGRTLKDFARLRAVQGDLAGALELGRQAVAALRQSEDGKSLAEAQALVQECQPGSGRGTVTISALGA